LQVISVNSVNRQSRGFTLIEVLVASVVLSFIVIVAHQAIYTARESGDLAARHSRELRNLDRVWVLLEADFRNILAEAQQASFNQALPALRIDDGEEHVLMLLRAGHANPLLLPRSEVIRVGYRLEDEQLWRDTWIDAANPEDDYARPQLLLDDVEELSFRVLPRAPRGRSISEGPWFERWPEQANLNELPLMIEVSLTTKRRQTITRSLTLLGSS
jgi:general secretion pathway protein J